MGARGGAEGETETLFANSLSVRGWELSLDGSMTLRPDADTLSVEVEGGHVALRE